MGHLSTVVVALLGAFAASHGAPTAILQPAQYYLIQPQPSTLKIQPQLIQPIQQLKLEPKQYVYYYPSLPLAATTTTTHTQFTEGKPIHLVNLKQEGGGDWWSSVLSFLQPPTTEMPAEEGETTEAPASKGTLPEKKLMFVAPEPAKAGETPASTTAALPQRYYILSGAPQFYGNYDALRNPLSAIFSLQPLQAIHARANAADIQAEDELQPKFTAQIVSSLAPIAPVPAGVPAQLKNDLLESHQDKEQQTIDRAWARSLDDEPELPQPDKQQVMVVMVEDEPVIVQGRSKVGGVLAEEEEAGQAPGSQPAVVRALVALDEEKEEQKEGKELLGGVQRSVNDPSIAAAKPSGNFFEDDEDAEKKKP